MSRSLSSCTRCFRTTGVTLDLMTDINLDRILGFRPESGPTPLSRFIVPTAILTWVLAPRSKPPDVSVSWARTNSAPFSSILVNLSFFHGLWKKVSFLKGKNITSVLT